MVPLSSSLFFIEALSDLQRPQNGPEMLLDSVGSKHRSSLFISPVPLATPKRLAMALPFSALISMVWDWSVDSVGHG